MRLRVGFIGLGAMGFSHLNSIARLCRDDAEITAICSTNSASIRKALDIAPGAKVCKRESELLAAPLDAVFVSTPNFTHVPLALEALKRGLHLFLEKPCGITNEDCRRLLNASKKTDRIVMIGHELRYSPFFAKIKHLIDSGEIGKPRMVWCREFRGPFQKKSKNWIQDNRRSGGTLVDKNCHHFDLMNWWAGARPARVCAFGGNAVNRVLKVSHQANDHATVSFEYAGGIRGTLHLCMFALDFPHEDLEMGIIGDKGLLQTRISKLEILQWKRGSGQKAPIVHRIKAKFGQGWGNHLGFDEIHTGFIDCIAKNRPPLTSVPQCIDATLLAIAAEASIRKNRSVDVLNLN